MCKDTFPWLLIIVFVFLLLASLTRFYCLNWSFWGDEINTFGEVNSLLNEPFFTSELKNPHNYQARANPVGYYLQALTYRFFGKSEVGTRIGPATAGALAIPLIVFLASRLYSRVTGIVLGGMLVLCPWHIFFSQNNRYYAYAFLFGSMALLAAAFAWKYNNFKWALFSGTMTAIAVSTHNLTIVIPIGLGTFAIFECVRQRILLSRQALIGYAISGVPLLFVSSFLAWIAMRNWIGAQTWGYTSIHTLMGLAFNLNWGIACVTCAGWIWTWNSQEPLDRIWTFVTAIAAFLAILAPLFLPFRHDYIFPVTLAFFMLAARVITQIYEATKERSVILAVGVLFVFIFLSFPQFISYYMDGDRPNYRAAAKFIEEHYQSGDAVVANAYPFLVKYYLPSQMGTVSMLKKGEESISHLEQLVSSRKRFWLVYRLSREEPPPNIDQWLWENAVRMLRIKKKRFDYHENVTDVYLIQRNRL